MRDCYKKITAAGLAGILGWGILAAAVPKTWATDQNSDQSRVATTAKETIQTPKIYGIGSTSKVFTAAAVMQLAEAGMLDLDQPLTDYIPEFVMSDSRYKQITPRMLINHSAGLQGSSLQNTMLYGDADRYHHDTLLEQLQTQRLKADPGEYSVYCNDGFTLAEILVERVSGMSFTEYLEKHFWQPAGLKTMGTTQSISDQSGLAAVYYQGINRLPYEYANVIGSGGMYGTAADLSQAGQIFVRDPKASFQILSDDTVREMEKPQFTPGYGLDPDIPSGMGYGYGWDSIADPVFQKYGMKALSKGGDTSQYHSMLTVLPEQQISCAVVSSGGSSSYNQMIVQEIILTYLEETGQINRADNQDILGEESWKATEMPEEMLDYNGWYVGAGVYRIAITADGILTLTSNGTLRDTTQKYQYIGDDSFVSLEGSYINGAGELKSAEAGTHGISKLMFTEESEGRYLGIVTQESNPGLGEQTVNIPLAQQCESHKPDEAAASAWAERAGKEYLLTGEKFTSSQYLYNPAIHPILYSGLEGYLGEQGGDFIARIKNQDQAEFFQKLPGQYGRDLVDITIEQTDQGEYLNARYRYISSDNIAEFTNDMKTVSIGNKRDTIWYRSDQGWSDRTVKIRAPENGHFYIYAYIEDKYTCVASSIIGDNNKPLYIPEHGRIAFVGEPGAEFAITAGQS